MLTNNDRLARILMPAVRDLLPADDLDRKKRIDHAITGDGKIAERALSSGLITQPLTLTWQDAGTITTAQLGPRYVTPIAYELRQLIAGIATPATGQAIIVHIETPDNEEYASLTIPAGENYAFGDPLAVFIDPGSWIRAQIDQVGSGTAGADLSIHAVLWPVEG